MDLSAILLPGAQNLVSAMLGDTWSAARSALSHVWARGDSDRTHAMEQELDEVRAETLDLRGHGPLDDATAQQIVTYCAGYLRHLVLERPDVVAALQALPTATIAGRDAVTVTGGAAQVINGDITGSAFSIQQHTGDINLHNRA